MDITLVGGGPLDATIVPLFRSFVTAAGTDPVIACVILDEGATTTPWFTPADLREALGRTLEPFGRWTRVLTTAAPCRTMHVPVPLGGTLDLAALRGATGLLVAGGLTPGYADALVPVREALREWLERTGAPYAGFSAGAACAAERAVVGGWLVDGVPVCPGDAAEDLEEVTVTRGLGLVTAMVDVHCSQWGTLPRLLAAVRAEAASGPVEGWGLDESTAVHLDDRGATVWGRGHVYRVRRESNDEVTVRPFGGFQVLPQPAAPATPVQASSQPTNSFGG